MKKKTADKFILAAAVLFAVYGVIVLTYLGIGHWFNFASWIVAVFFAALYALRQSKIKIRRTVKVLFFAVLAAALCCFSSFEYRAIDAALNAVPAADAEWILVLGAKVNGTVPSLEFARRLDAAAAYAEQHEVKIMVTGGKGSDEGISEAECAKNYLVSAGISEDRIVCETESTSTSENFLYAKEREADFEKKNIVVVSSAFHLYRAGLIGAQEGYTNLSYLGSVGKIILLPQYFAREYAAYVREFGRIL